LNWDIGEKEYKEFMWVLFKQGGFFMKEKSNDRDIINLSQLRQMEIIDISEGKRLGFIGDIIFDDDFTKIDSLVIPSQSGFFSIFKRKDDVFIKWNQIKVIGIDIIIVDLSSKTVGETRIVRQSTEEDEI